MTAVTKRTIIKCLAICLAWLHGSALLLAQSGILQQPFTFQKTTFTVNEAFSEITLRTGYSFLYNSAVIKIGNESRTSTQTTCIEEALNALLRDTTLGYTVIDKYIVISKKRQNQPNYTTHPADNILVLRGTIVDSHNSQPLPYASIAIINDNISIIANEEGSFALKIPLRLSQAEVYVSCLGYHPLKIAIPPLGDSPVTFPLQRDVVSLQEVIIRNPDPLSLIKSAIHKISLNYSTTACNMTGFYREVIRKNNDYQMVSEAALDLYKSSYSQAVNDDRIRLLKSRKLVNYKNLDTLMVKIKAGLNTCIMLDIAKNIPDFLDERYLSEYTYGIPDMVKYNDELSFVIPFQQRENIAGPHFCGEIFINANNLAILGANFEINPSQLDNIADQITTYKKRKYILTPQKIGYKVSYRPLNGRYYLHHTRFEIAFKVRRRHHLFSKSYHVISEMATSNIDTLDVKKIPKNEACPVNAIFSEVVGKYDENFWGKENIIQPELPLEQAMMKISERLVTK
jgi:hypothetical protein